MQSLTSRLAPEAGDELAAPEERAAAVPSLDPAAVWRIYVPRLASYGIPIALSVHATDDNSGVSEVQFSASSDFSRAWWQPYPTTGNAVWYAPSRPQQVWARVCDAAGNISGNVVSVRLPQAAGALWRAWHGGAPRCCRGEGWWARPSASQHADAGVAWASRADDARRHRALWSRHRHRHVGLRVVMHAWSTHQGGSR
jgi:hypothetical protein